jgi:predicted amidohydrolase YtcJ
MAVLAEDPFQIEPERIKDLRVEMTVVGGEIKYQA